MRRRRDWEGRLSGRPESRSGALGRVNEKRKQRFAGRRCAPQGDRRVAPPSPAASSAVVALGHAGNSRIQRRRPIRQFIRTKDVSPALGTRAPLSFQPKQPSGLGAATRQSAPLAPFLIHHAAKRSLTFPAFRTIPGNRTDSRGILFFVRGATPEAAREQESGKSKDASHDALSDSP